MDIQTILVIILFAGALFYVGRIVYRSIAPKNGGCGSNCKCGVDFSNVKIDKK
ncbi:FeoB-associated Cys-rich membrane protein [Pedobacter panaciterrae]|jgi:hypothetical protein|uniref:FeoB-associated Cys-rich membrane protein n=1 Tax=Pedobacter panaciterrae TaxID=363849 RepID=A0ABU8NNC9_9SPHI|nr:FeoB-associated Cys-rich membrane protein [Pedobacter panaciterrae]NQX55327.1 FeoB-associated Cys-rich membrane protein [Pedobacter panaciterrae]